MADNPLKKVGGFVANEMLGVDDFGRVFTKAMEGDVSGALKSAGAGALELGSTLLTGGVGAVAKQGAKAGVKAAVKQGAKESVEAGVKSSTYKSAPSPSDLLGAQFKPKAGTITKPKVTPKPAKPGDLPGAPGYPRTPAKPGDLPGAPGYPKPAPAPKPMPKPMPKPKPAPAPAPAKPATKPATKPAVKPSTKPSTKPKAGVENKPSTGPQWRNIPKALPAAGTAGLLGAAGIGYMLGKKSEKKEEGPWNPSAIV